MDIQPLSKDIYEKAKSLDITEIKLCFSGGSDEGFLDIEVTPWQNNLITSFSKEIEDWAWSVYEYSGAGEGRDYGDNITYDLKNNEVHADEWFHAPQHNFGEPTKLEISDKED